MLLEGAHQVHMQRMRTNGWFSVEPEGLVRNSDKRLCIKCVYHIPGTTPSALYTFYPLVHVLSFNPHTNPSGHSDPDLRMGKMRLGGGLVVPTSTQLVSWSSCGKPSSVQLPSPPSLPLLLPNLNWEMQM